MNNKPLIAKGSDHDFGFFAHSKSQSGVYRRWHAPNRKKPHHNYIGKRGGHTHTKKKTSEDMKKVSTPSKVLTWFVPNGSKE
jgi:hypothetical protein